MSWFSDAFRSAGDWVVDQVEAIGDWIGDQVDSVWNWLDDNISGLPLKFFSAMADLFPSQSFGGVQYFKPNHADNDVNALMGGSKWNKATITYSLPDSKSDYGWLNPSASGFYRLSAKGEEAVHSAMASVAGYVNTGIAYVGRDGADVQVGGFQPNSIITRNHGYYPGVPVYGGDTWLNVGSQSHFTKGTAAYSLVMHELGHSLGLKHSHDHANGIPKMSAARDSTEYTVMSYNDTEDRPQSFMQYDIAALQAMYGADFTTNSGDTVYRWNSSTGEMYINGYSQGLTNEGLIFLTIWDGGGIDTYDMSNYGADTVIDLAPGGFSRFSQAQLANVNSQAKVNGNVYNAFQFKGDSRSLIENAIGGSGADQILGNQAYNFLRGLGAGDVLNGKGGNDTLDGGMGDDTLLGGAGTDHLIGSFGIDWVSYADAAGGVSVSLADGRGYHGSLGGGGAAAGDTYDNIENVEGSHGHDVLAGNAGSNWLKGIGGDDILQGGWGADTLDGGAGFNWASYTNAATGVTANLANQALNTGEAAGDIYIDIRGLQGSQYGDYLVADATTAGNALSGFGGNDTLQGGTGGDALEGGEGSDRLSGGAGSDQLIGGQGADKFCFDTALGVSNVDRISDFNILEDKIELDSRIFTGLYSYSWGALVDWNFKAGLTAGGQFSQIVYNSATGELFYDADGSGAGAQIKFAEISKGLALTSSHFLFV
ncbi:M10 family metallopeptidase [Microvirga sp. VF16]|uniref:M10 family metallopeptidase n=1 Tax=Microvirga sp. VF16 TaxID=2807101 RepID=UPI00193D49E1|nr:M10 family metallopeptidase [Microvirga sp. VF16]QRM31469.1 M10 family metallopeptidase C-terminal domain-containing protein [Microvirga sp. VF16]